MTIRASKPLSFVFLAALAACGNASDPATPQAQAPSVVAPVATETPVVAPVVSNEPKAEAPKAPVVRFTGFATPESVLYDEARDRYLVSNVNGKPTDTDNNGFISELSPDGKVTALKWIEAGKNKVTLHAPKGMAIVKEVLYVADIDTLRMFDVKSGAPKGEIKLPGVTFANDVAASADGKIYVSDSGLKFEAGDFKPTGTDAVWVIEGGKAKAFAKSADLARPNGLYADGKSVVVVPFGSQEIYRLDEKGQRVDITKLPKGGFDGVVKVGDSWLVSSWEGQAVYKGKLGGTFEPLFTSLKAPADIGFDTKRSRVLVPRFMEDAVEAYDVH
jgi:sugar lactone lactonase YvrE